MIERILSPASFDLAGLKLEGPVILVIPALAAILFAAIASLVWLYRDAQKRNKYGLVAILFVLLTGWPVSFIWWFWLRPPTESKGEA